MGGDMGTNVAAEAPAAAAGETMCWICKTNKADAGEHKTKRSDLLAVLGNPTQEKPFFYHDVDKPNRPVGSLDAKILKSPVRICAHCNNARSLTIALGRKCPTGCVRGGWRSGSGSGATVSSGILQSAKC